MLIEKDLIKIETSYSILGKIVRIAYFLACASMPEDSYLPIALLLLEYIS